MLLRLLVPVGQGLRVVALPAAVCDNALSGAFGQIREAGLETRIDLRHQIAQLGDLGAGLLGRHAAALDLRQQFLEAFAEIFRQRHERGALVGRRRTGDCRHGSCSTAGRRPD